MKIFSRFQRLLERGDRLVCHLDHVIQEISPMLMVATLKYGEEVLAQSVLHRSEAGL